MNFDLTKLDIQMMKDIDSLPQGPEDSKYKGVIWMRDDYLCMRGMFTGVVGLDRKHMYELLEKIARIKDEMKADGYVFNCDRWYEFESEG